MSIVATKNISIAGESNSFICIVTKTITSGFKSLPLAVWVENGTEITQQGESNATLAFNKTTSHGKVYTCRGTLSSPALSTPLVVMESYSLVVKSND